MNGTQQVASWLRGRAVIALALVGIAGSMGGCYAQARTGAVVTAEYVPPQVETYPSYYYEGRVVYLVGDRWYYRDGPHWVYYASEPTVLVRRRAYVREQGVVHQAPPAHYRRHAPPSYHRREAPPRRQRVERHRHHHH